MHRREVGSEYIVARGGKGGVKLTSFNSDQYNSNGHDLTRFVRLQIGSLFGVVVAPSDGPRLVLLHLSDCLDVLHATSVHIGNVVLGNLVLILVSHARVTEHVFGFLRVDSYGFAKEAFAGVNVYFDSAVVKMAVDIG